MQTKPLITVQEARKLLGIDSKPLSDTQVQEIINTLSDMAHAYLENSGSNNTLGV